MALRSASTFCSSESAAPGEDARKGVDLAVRVDELRDGLAVLKGRVQLAEKCVDVRTGESSVASTKGLE